MRSGGHGSLARRVRGDERQIRGRRVEHGANRSAGRLRVMDAGFLHGVWTAALLAVFAAIVVWAWSGRRKRSFEEAARLPLEDDAKDAAEWAWNERRRHDFDDTARRPPGEGATDPQKRGARHG